MGEKRRGRLLVSQIRADVIPRSETTRDLHVSSVLEKQVQIPRAARDDSLQGFGSPKNELLPAA
ncbi:MAG: hypothetical protein A3H94_05065 [Acidobacteria bacterium RIFCSPLOWO2_02_FULL_60_20]|nr:MAG: hypothetical protein A3H94_05065 [Acidobacteria bacterium RIFCSPLOWO2_02_FULL_60_20]